MLKKSAIVKIQAAIIAIVIVVAAVAGVFAYYTYFAPKPSPAPPTAKIPVELAGRYFLKNNPKVILDLLENGRCFYGPSAGKWWVEGDRVIIELSYATFWLTIKNGTLVENGKIWVKTTLTPSPTPPKPETPTPFLPAAARVGDFSIDVSKVDRQEDIATLYFAITKVADTDSEGGKLEVTLTDDHGNQYSGTLNVNLGGAPSQVIPLLPTGFTYVDSISITMPRQAPIETIRFGDEPEMGFKDLQLVEPSFKQDFGEMTVEPGASVRLGKWLTFTFEFPTSDPIGWTLPITIVNTEYNPLPIEVNLGLQLVNGTVIWLEEGSAKGQVPASGNATLKPRIFTISQAIKAIESGSSWTILISFADKETGEHALKLMPTSAEQFRPIPERIAFESGYGIYAVRSDGSGDKFRITDYGKMPSWSPDGDKIAFVSWDNIIVAFADGTGETYVCKGGYPRWSPYGKKLVYVGGLLWTTIYTINIDGTGETKIVEGVHPNWSPDGTKIIFSTSRDKESRIYVIASDGTGRPQLLGEGYAPAWSPDGKKIVFVHGDYILGGDYTYGGDIYVMNADGSGKIKLARGGDPVWSPDGKKIAFTGYRRENGSLYLIISVINADGSGLTELTNGEYPAWAPAFDLGTQTVPLGMTKSDLVKALKDLREAMLKKLDRDIENTAIAFTDVKDYWRTKRWADIFTVPLRVLEDTLILLAKAADLKSLTQEANAALDESEAAYQVLSVVMMLHGLQEVGEKLQYGLDGPTYVAAIESMLEEADATFIPPSGDDWQKNYKKVIENHLYGTAEDTPLRIPRRSTTADRKIVEFAFGALQVRSSIDKKFDSLIAEIESRELPKDFPIDEVTAQVKELRQQVVKSMSYSTDVRYRSYLNGQGTYVETKLGAVGQLYRAFGEVAGKVDQKLAIEERVEVLKLAETAESGALLYTVTYKIPGVEEIKVVQKATTLAELMIKSYQSPPFSADVEEKFYMLPQEMVLSLPVELSNLWMIADDTDQYMRYLLGIELTPTPPTLMTGEITIGALLPLTGALATFGENSKVAIDMAVEEVNEFLKASGAKWTLKIVVEDIQTNPDVALTKLKSLAARGIKFIIGPMSSGEVRAIKGYLDANKILGLEVFSSTITFFALRISPIPFTPPQFLRLV